MPIKYPPTRAEDFVEELHGVQVPDPYRWMEDLDSDELRQWIEAQNDLTFDLLDSSPLREEIRERMTTLWNYEKVSAPTNARAAISTSITTGYRIRMCSIGWAAWRMSRRF